MIAVEPPKGLLRLSEERYHGLPQLSRSQLTDFMFSPMQYYQRHIAKDPVWQVKSTSAMDFGTACHRAILIDRDATKAFVEIPQDVLTTDGKKFGKKFDRWAMDHPGKFHLKESEAAVWETMWDSLKACGPARELLLDDYDGSMEEITALWADDAIDCRCRIDRVIPGIGIVDLKTCAKADLNSIQKEILTRNLDVQAAWYRWGWECNRDERLPFTFVFLEKNQPYRTVCVTLDENWLGMGWLRIREALSRMQKCADANDWEDPHSTCIHVLKRPGWADSVFTIGEE